MNYLKSLKIYAFSLMFSVLVSAGTFAQQQGIPPQVQQEVNDDFSDAEIETFVKINKEIMPLQEDVQDNMVKKIEEKGLEVERFQQLAQAQQTQTLTEASDDPREIAAFNEAGQEVIKLQQGLQVQIQEVIVKNKMEPEKFEAIYMAYSASPKVKEKVDKLLFAEGEG